MPELAPPFGQYLEERVAEATVKDNLEKRLRRDNRLRFYNQDIEKYVGLDKVDIAQTYSELIGPNIVSNLTSPLTISVDKSNGNSLNGLKYTRLPSEIKSESQDDERNNKLVLSGENDSFNLLDYYSLAHSLGSPEDKKIIKNRYEDRLDSIPRNLFAMLHDIDKRIEDLPLLESEQRLASQQNHFAWGAYMFGFKKAQEIYSRGDENRGNNEVAPTPDILKTFGYADVFASLQRAVAYMKSEYGEDGYESNFAPILEEIFNHFDKEVIGKNSEYCKHHIREMNIGADSEVKGFNYLREQYGDRVIWTDTLDDVRGLDAYIVPVGSQCEQGTNLLDLPLNVRSQITGVNFKSSSRPSDPRKDERIVKTFGISEIEYIDSSSI